MNIKAVTKATLIMVLSLALPLKSETLLQAKTNGLTKDLVSQDDWQLWTSESGLFSIQMPERPEEQTKETRILGNPTNWTLFKLNQDSDVYAVAYLDLTEEVLERGAQDTLESLKNAILSPLGLQELDLRGRRIELNNYPGREFLGIQSGKVTTVRLYLVGQRLYGLVAASDTTAKINQFLNSFEVESAWKSVSSDLGNFEVRLPTTPTTEIEQLQVDNKQLTWNFWRAAVMDAIDNQAEVINESETESENLYAVGYANLPSDWNQRDSKNLLNQVASTLLERLNLQLLSDDGREITLGDNPGREFLGIGRGRIFAVRLYQVEQQLYGLITVTDDVTDVERFFNSFQLREL
ncbi:hypothetical protein [Myxosarcina sp. GI1(2024)]